ARGWTQDGASPADGSTGTIPPTGPHPISPTAAGGAGSQPWTNGHIAASHCSSDVTPPQPTPGRGGPGLPPRLESGQAHRRPAAGPSGPGWDDGLRER